MSELAKPHPISLEKLNFIRSVVIAIPGHEPGDRNLVAGAKNNIDVKKIPGEGRQYHAVMRSVMNEEKSIESPYFVDMECFAVLTADETLSDEDALRGMYITAHSVLFGAIREAVLWISSRQPYGPLQLGLSVLGGTMVRKSEDVPKNAPEP